MRPLQRKIAMLMKRTKTLLFLLFAMCILPQCTTTVDEIYHIVTTVCEDAATGVTVNYHCSRSDSYVLVTQADDSTFRHAKKVKPVSRPWSSVGIENTSTESTFYTDFLELWERIWFHAENMVKTVYRKNTGWVK